MSLSNSEMAARLDQLADLLEIEGENAFRIRAYRNAARLVESFSRRVTDMVAAGEDLTQYPGIGAALAQKLKEMAETDRLTALEKEQKKLPATLTALLKIPGLGPKRVHLIYEKLKITNREDLERAVREGRLGTLEGFGDKITATISDYLKTQATAAQRTRLDVADQIVQPLLDYLRSVPGLKQAAAAGSYRRRQETIGDVDILAAGAKPGAIMQAFIAYPGAAQVISHGETRSSIILKSGLQADLRVVPEASYGAALHYFTGSKAHNIAVRARGVKAGLKINEYGVFRNEKSAAGRTEDEVYNTVGLPYIEPELRENRGEIEAAEQQRLPRLVASDDICGDLQSHTDATDGRHSLAEMARAAQTHGYEYLAITDHSQKMAMAHGLNATRLRRQISEIGRLNETFQGFRLLKSIEVDILADGSLDLSDDILKELDLVVAAAHFRFNLSREKQTERLIRALDNPLVTILAHPSGRLIGERPPYEVDMEKLMAAVKARGCFMELNAQPSRLDLNDIHCRMARELGIKVAISTDAHHAGELDFMRFGLGQARRGWLEKDDVLNTRNWDALKKLLKRG